MAYFTDDFNRTTPGGPGGGTHGNPSYGLGSNWISWNGSVTPGVVIFSGKATQFENFSFWSVMVPTAQTTTDDQAVRFQINSSMNQEFRIGLRVHDSLVAAGPTTFNNPDAETPNGQITLRVQMNLGTPGEVTVIIDNSYQGPTNISGAIDYEDSTPHVVEARVIGDTVSLRIDGVEVFTRNDMGTLPSGSSRRNVSLTLHSDNDPKYVENWESGDYPLSSSVTEDITPSLFAPGAIFAAATGTSITPVIPAGDIVNDILIMSAMCNGASTFTTPTDWTEFTGTAVNSANHSSAWFWKRATGSDGNPTSTTSATGSGTVGLYGRIWVYRRCATSGDPFEDATVNGSPTTSTTPASAAIDTTGAFRLAVCLVAVDDDNTLGTNYPPNEWLPHAVTFLQASARVASTTGGDGMYDGIQRWMPVAGSVASVTVGTMANDYWRTLTFALLPVAAAVAALPWRNVYVAPSVAAHASHNW